MSYIVPCRHVSILLDRARWLHPQLPSPPQAPLQKQPWDHTEHSILSWGHDSKDGTSWLIHFLGPPRATLAGTGLPSSQRPQGSLGSAHCLLRGPSPLSPAQGRQPCPLMPGCPFVPGCVPVDGAHVTQVDLGSGQALE